MPNNILEISGIDVFIAEAIMEIIKSNIIAIFLIKLIVCIVVYKKQIIRKLPC